MLLHVARCVFPAVRDSGADAGADVSPQGVRPQPTRLPQDYALPEVAEDRGSTWCVFVELRQAYCNKQLLLHQGLMLKA